MIVNKTIYLIYTNRATNEASVPCKWNFFTTFVLKCLNGTMQFIINSPVFNVCSMDCK